MLATGGLETARLLLAFRDVAPQGVGNEHDVVGRYYMCHIAGNVGTLTLHGRPNDVRHGYEVTPDGVYCRRRLPIAPREQRRRGLANAVARLHFPRITDPRAPQRRAVGPVPGAQADQLRVRQAAERRHAATPRDCTRATCSTC